MFDPKTGQPESSAPQGDLQVLEELAYKNALAFQSLKDDLVSLRLETLKQRDVAERLGVSQAAVSQFEAAENDPRLSTLEAYAFAVGAPVAVVVGSPRSAGGWATTATSSRRPPVATINSWSIASRGATPQEPAREKSVKVPSGNYVLAA